MTATDLDTLGQIHALRVDVTTLSVFVLLMARQLTGGDPIYDERALLEEVLDTREEVARRMATPEEVKPC